MRESIHSVEGAAGTRNFGVILALCVGIGALTGILARPDAWFFALEKPIFFPPQGLLSTIWLIYFFSMAYIGGRLWRWARTSPRIGRSSLAWIVQLLCALSWPIALYEFQALRFAVFVVAMGALCALAISWRLRRLEGYVVFAALMCSAWLCVLMAFTLGLALGNIG